MRRACRPSIRWRCRRSNAAAVALFRAAGPPSGPAGAARLRHRLPEPVDAAKAAFYPHFDIKAFWGYNALSVGDLFKSSFQQINLLPGLYLPIFDGGRLNANLQSVRTASNILIKQYNQAVLDAVRDVAISSSQLNDLNQQRALQQLKVTAAQTTTDSARAHYQRGLLSRYAAEEARRAVLAQQLLLLDIEAQRLSTDITLIKAWAAAIEGNNKNAFPIGEGIKLKRRGGCAAITPGAQLFPHIGGKEFRMLNHQPFAGGDRFSPLRHFIGKPSAPALLLAARSGVGRGGGYAQFF